MARASCIRLTLLPVIIYTVEMHWKVTRDRQKLEGLKQWRETHSIKFTFKWLFLMWPMGNKTKRGSLTGLRSSVRAWGCVSSCILERRSTRKEEATESWICLIFYPEFLNWLNSGWTGQDFKRPNRKQQPEAGRAQQRCQQMSGAGEGMFKTYVPPS